MKFIFKLLIVIAVIALIVAAVLVIGHFAGWFNVSTDLVGDTVTHDCVTEITKLNIDVGIADLSVVKGDKLRVETNHKNVKIKENNGTLEVVEEKFSVGLNVTSVPFVKIYLPDSMIFDELSVKTSAGKVSADFLSAKRLQCELGAGVAVFGRLSTSEQTHIKGGAGNIQILSGDLRDLNMDLGAGATTVTARLRGFTTLQCGAGALDLTLTGTKSDYSLSVDKGIGSAKIGGQPIENGKVYGDGADQVRVKGGVGAVNVGFSGD